MLARFRLSLDALGEWLKNPEGDDRQREEASEGDYDVESSNSKIRNIWKNDLLLENATDRYVCRRALGVSPNML